MMLKACGTKNEMHVICALYIPQCNPMGPLLLIYRSNKYKSGEYCTKWDEVYPMPNMEAGSVAELFV